MFTKLTSYVKGGATLAIGDTPLIGLDKIHHGSGRLLAKMEYLQPGGSVKDRTALRCIQDAYAYGRLTTGQPVIEATSGNMGAGLAIVCAATENPFIAVMSEGNSPARAAMLKALGAEVLLVPQVNGTPGKVTGADWVAVEEMARRIAIEQNAFFVDQFHNDSGILAHQEGTGPEIWRATQGRMDAFVACVGSAGSFIGVARFLKQQNPGILCVAVEPEGAQILAGKTVVKATHIIQGTGYGLIPAHWDPALADAYLAVSDEEVLRTTAELARQEGLFVGYSAGANVCAANNLLASGLLPADATVVTLLCDTGFKYI
ncbi:MAG: cysteine synthase family protein [Elusimicrobiota bacterium]